MKHCYLKVVIAAAIVGCLFAPSVSAQAPSLGTAEDFSVLAGSGVTNSGPTVVQGDLGVHPGTSVTGFPPGIVNGTTHIADGVALQAQTDLTTAYDALVLLPCGTNLTGQDLGGLTLTAGVYCFDTSAQLTGTLTLDAQEDPNAEFIFKIGSTLTTASNSNVNVINGGNNCNIYWQVGSSATLGTTTSFAGNILALTSITVNTGANASGRLLARNGAVTLDSNGIAVCIAAGVTCPVIAIAPATLPSGRLDEPYSETITASGGTAAYIFTIVSGALPPGLTLLPGGTLSGTPTTLGTFNFTVQATDAAGCQTVRTYSLIVGLATAIPALDWLGMALMMVLLGTAAIFVMNRLG